MAERDIYLNRAKNWLIPQWARHVGRNGYIDDQLSVLITRGEDLEKVNETTTYVDFKYPSDLIRAVRHLGVFEHVDDCCEPMQARIRVLSSDKIDDALRSSFRSPSFKYRETVAIAASGGVRVYRGEMFKVTGATVDYVRLPKDIQTPSLEEAEGYINAKGEPVTQDIPLELTSPEIIQKIVNIAVLHARNDNNYLQNFQSKLQEQAQLPALALR